MYSKKEPLQRERTPPVSPGPALTDLVSSPSARRLSSVPSRRDVLWLPPLGPCLSGAARRLSSLPAQALRGEASEPTPHGPSLSPVPNPLCRSIAPVARRVITWPVCPVPSLRDCEPTGAQAAPRARPRAHTGRPGTEKIQ